MIVTALYLVSFLVNPVNARPAGGANSLSAYECGFEAYEEARNREFDI
jgi:NADH:ubiquinone oxidoreductase subunit 3 (subunit A)